MRSIEIKRDGSTITVRLHDRADHLYAVTINSDRDGFDAESQQIARSCAMLKRSTQRFRDLYPIDFNGRTELGYAFRKESSAESFYEKAIEIAHAAKLIKVKSKKLV